MENIKIINLDQLKENIKKGQHEYKIALNYGVISRKYIALEEENVFFVVNLIDGSKQTIKGDDMFNKQITNIGIAIRKGALYLDE